MFPYHVCFWFENTQRDANGFVVLRAVVSQMTPLGVGVVCCLMAIVLASWSVQHSMVWDLFAAETLASQQSNDIDPHVWNRRIVRRIEIVAMFFYESSRCLVAFSSCLQKGFVNSNSN